MPPKKATEASPATAKAADEPTVDIGDKDAPPYGEAAAELAADVRDMAEQMLKDLADLNARVDKLHTTSAPTADEGPAADGVRRIPMATEDVTRAVHGLLSTAADLQRAAG